MRTVIVAASMARARIVADDHGWPRSAWVFARSGADIQRQPDAALFIDRTWDQHTAADGIADAISARLNPFPGRWGAPSNLPRLRRGTGTLRSSKEGRNGRRIA